MADFRTFDLDIVRENEKDSQVDNQTNLKNYKHLDRTHLYHPIIISRPRSSTRRCCDAANREWNFWICNIFLKPSYDVRHMCGANRDNFKHFGDTPSYNSRAFEFESSAHFPTGGAVSDNMIPDLGVTTIDANVRLRKVGR